MHASYHPVALRTNDSEVATGFCKKTLRRIWNKQPCSGVLARWGVISHLILLEPILGFRPPYGDGSLKARTGENQRSLSIFARC